MTSDQRVAIVTGSSSGIGRATAVAHAKLMRATELIGTRVAPALREVDENYIEVS